MQRKQQQKELPPGQSIMATILQSIPKEANVTKINYEGPRSALLTTSPKYLMEHNEIISNLVNVIKKRIVVRTDESIRKLEEEYRDDLNVDDAKLLALRAVKAAITRNIGTGDGINVSIINKDGFQLLTKEQKKAIINL